MSDMKNKGNVFTVFVRPVGTSRAMVIPGGCYSVFPFNDYELLEMQIEGAKLHIKRKTR